MIQDGSYRVFGVGFNKTGTSTLKHCLVELGLDPVAKLKNSEKQKCIRAILNNENYEPALAVAKRYRCFEDRPWNIWEMYQQLDERFPGSRFILTIREEAEWWKSVENWLTAVKPDMLKRYCDHLQIPSTLPDIGKKSWLGLFAKSSSHRTNAKSGKASVARYKDQMINGFRNYNNRVIKYFSGRSDFLILDFETGDGWNEICQFLNLAIPPVPLPHANKQFYDDRDKLKRVKKKIKEQGELNVFIQ